MCVPSRRPTTDIKMKNKITATEFGTLEYIVVLPAKRAVKVTTKEKVKIPTDIKHRAQKKTFCPRVRGGSLVVSGWPANLVTIIWITYEAWRSPENSRASETYSVNIIK